MIQIDQSKYESLIRSQITPLIMLLLMGTWYVVSLTVVFTCHLVYYCFGEISAVNFHCVHSE